VAAAAVLFDFRWTTVKLTAIRAQQRERGRVNIDLDGEYAFSLQITLATRLTVGQELSAEQIVELQAADVTERAYERALGYLSYRPRSADEIRRYLTKRDLELEAIEQVLQRLERARLVDDRQFADFWVENRETFRPRGAWALRAEMRQKGIAEPVISAALDDLDERASAMRAAEPAARRYRRQEQADFCRHLMGFLQRRGFPYGVAREVTEHYWEQIQTDLQPESGY
jgi:regulatory protein